MAQSNDNSLLGAFLTLVCHPDRATAMPQLDYPHKVTKGISAAGAVGKNGVRCSRRALSDREIIEAQTIKSTQTGGRKHANTRISPSAVPVKVWLYARLRFINTLTRMTSPMYFPHPNSGIFADISPFSLKTLVLNRPIY